MKNKSDCREAFLALVRAGLWGVVNENENPNENLFEGLDWSMVQKLAEEQSVMGLVAAGAEWFTVNGSRCMIPLTEKLTLLGRGQLIEQRNEAMNRFIAELLKRMREADIKVVLVKGQGVAQCYEKPLWRTAGDIDLLLDEENYKKTKTSISALSEKTVSEDIDKKHLSVQIGGFTIELHGRMPFVLSRRADKVIDEVIADTCKSGGTREWRNGSVIICLPKANNDVILVFTHYLHHFFIEGVGLKQVCDWCRLLWTYRDELDKKVLEIRLRDMGLMSEWKVFASLAVNKLGMPSEAMPFYNPSSSYKRKAKRALTLVLKSGNLGHNKDVSYRAKHSAFIANVITFFRRLRDFVGFSLIFPVDSPKFFLTYCTDRIKNYGNR